LELKALKNIELADNNNLIEFVTTLDLMHFRPSAKWLPLIVDSKFFSLEPKVLSHVPIVLHIPSSSKMKGTPHILPILLRLSEKGLIELNHPTHHVNHAHMIELMKQSDWVIDQYAGMSYGLTSCEAMALGKVVFSHIPDYCKDIHPSDLPIQPITLDTFEEDVKSLIVNTERLKEIQAQSMEYARKYHDGRFSADLLEKVLGISSKTKLPKR